MCPCAQPPSCVLLQLALHKHKHGTGERAAEKPTRAEVGDAHLEMARVHTGERGASTAPLATTNTQGGLRVGGRAGLHKHKHGAGERAGETPTHAQGGGVAKGGAQRRLARATPRAFGGRAAG